MEVRQNEVTLAMMAGVLGSVAPLATFRKHRVAVRTGLAGEAA